MDPRGSGSLQVLENGGRYRIRTYDFHRVKVAKCFVIKELRGMLVSAQECSGAYFSTRARKMDPQMDPRETGLAPTFSFDSLCIFAVAVLPTVAELASSAHWQLGPTSTARTNERLSQARARFGAPTVSLGDLSTSMISGVLRTILFERIAARASPSPKARH